jgi:hypothetical protein
MTIDKESLAENVAPSALEVFNSLDLVLPKLLGHCESWAYKTLAQPTVLMIANNIRDKRLARGKSG